MDNSDLSFRSLVNIIRQRGKKGVVFVEASQGVQPFFVARQLSRAILGKSQVESWSNFDLRRTFAAHVIAACPKNELLVLVGDDKFVLSLLRIAQISDNRKEL